MQHFTIGFFQRSLGVVVFLCLSLFAYAQPPCEIATTSSESILTCGDCATLNATGLGRGQLVFGENFNSGSPQGWAFTQQATFNNPCSPNGVDNTTHIWMGDNSPVPRELRTLTYDLTNAVAGATICFDMLFAEQGATSPCEGPDEPDEGVTLQYSIDGGNTWVEITYFDPNGGNDPDLINWNNWCFPIPPAAITSSTEIRWFQDNDSGAEYDHWGIDNVNINFNDPTYEVTWQHDNYSYGQGSTGGDNPTPVCPTTTTQYVATISNGTNTCRDTVTITVPPSTTNAFAGNDTTICTGDCVTLSGVGEVILNPGGVRTFATTEAVSIAAIGGLPSEVGLNLTDLNMTNVEPGSILSVCLNISDPFGLPPPFPSFMDVSTLNVSLECPGGTVIPLVLAGEATGVSFGGANIVNPGQSTCFTMSAGTTIPGGTPPYQGDFLPTSGTAFDDLVGCVAEGVWNLQVTSTNPISVGLVNSWSITIDDPPILGNANISWSPNTDITAGANTATPTICPNATGSYTMTVSDPTGCALSSSDAVTITVQQVCCNVSIDNVFAVQPNCGDSDGSLIIAASGGTPPLNYSIDGGNTFQAAPNFPNLPDGTYDIVVEDASGTNCQDTQQEVLSGSPAVNIDNVSTTNASCGQTNGEIAIIASGGTAPLSYTIDTGLNVQANGVFTGVPEGSFLAIVGDAAGCADTQLVIVGATSSITLTQTGATSASCGLADGSASVDASGGTGPYTYIWSNNQSGPTASGLIAGNYTVTAEDAGGCTSTYSVTILNNSAPTIDNVIVSQPSCGNNDGTIDINTTGGFTPITYSIDGGNNFQGTSSFTGLASGTYDIVVNDANNCQSVDQVILTDAGGPTIDNVAAVQPNCGANDGSITITASGGAAPLSYSIDNGVSSQAGGAFAGLATGTYDIIVEDANGCQATAQEVLTGGNALSITNITVVPTSCGDDNGSIDVTVTGGNPPIGYSIDAGGNIQATGLFDNLAAGPYLVGVGDGAGCVDTQTVIVAASSAVVISLDNTTDAACNQADGDATVSATGGNPTYTFTWSDNQTGATATGLAAGGYQVTVTDADGCEDAIGVSISNAGGPTVSITDSVDATCGQATGSATVTPVGGNPPYTYTWSSGDTDPTAVNLAPGIYTVDVQDAVGCIGAASVTIGDTGSITVTVATLDASCGGNSGVAIATGGNGQAPYTYAWDNLATGDTISGLASGSYSVTATDAAGCTATGSGLVGISGSLGTITNFTDASCDQDNGTAEVTPAPGAGTAPFTYIWDGGETTAQVTGLAPGNYTVTSSDASGCSAVDVFNIANNPGPDVIAAVVQPDSCGEDIGIISVAVTGGTSPYGIAWSHNSALDSFTATNLTEGLYDITVTDSNNCIATSAVDLPCVEDTIVIFYVPNAFSPNGDGNNDFFQVYGEGIITMNMEVFDRWGELVYSTQDPEGMWDGTFKDKLLKPGVFVFKADVTFKNRTFERFYGSLLLIQ